MKCKRSNLKGYSSEFISEGITVCKSNTVRRDPVCNRILDAVRNYPLFQITLVGKGSCVRGGVDDRWEALCHTIALHAPVRACKTFLRNPATPKNQLQKQPVEAAEKRTVHWLVLHVDCLLAAQWLALQK